MPESTVIIEYLARNYPGGSRLLPAESDAALEVRLADRIFDLYVHDPMQRIVGDRLRPEGKRDPHGVEMARAQLRTALDMTEARMTSRTWAAGETFSMADCAAAPALFYANKVMLFADTHRNTTDYLARLQQRPSFARVLEEAKPYFAMFPQ